MKKCLKRCLRSLTSRWKAPKRVKHKPYPGRCKCTVLNCKKITKPGSFLDFFTAIKCISQHFWVLLAAEMTDFPILLYTTTSQVKFLPFYRVFSLTWPEYIQIYWNKRKRLQKSSSPTGLVWDTNMAAVSLFRDANMAAVTSCENNVYT